MISLDLILLASRNIFTTKKSGDVKGKIINDYVSDFFGVPSDALERSILEIKKCPNDEEKEEIDKYLACAPALNTSHSREYEELDRKEKEKEPPLEMKPLPSELRYAYLDGSNKYPVIINAGLSSKEENKLLEILRRHKKALGYSLTDFMGLNPCLGMHKIPIAPDSKPFVDQL